MAPRTRRGEQKTGSDLPSLFPTHDGSYGINTLISPVADQGKESRRGHRSSAGIVPEKSDDRQWARAMKGVTGKKYGMNSDLRRAVDESHREVGNEHQGGDPDPSDSSSASGDSSSDASEENVSTLPDVPRYNPNRPRFAEELDRRPRPPFRRAQSSPLSPELPETANQSALPASEHIPFYGLPQGDGSKQPISPMRPDSSRSYDYESALFSSATFNTPGSGSRPNPLPGPFDGSSVFGSNPKKVPTLPAGQPAGRPKQPEKQSSAWQQPAASNPPAPPLDPAPALLSNSWGNPALSGQSDPDQSAPLVVESNQWGASALASAGQPAPVPESSTQGRPAPKRREAEGKHPGPNKEAPLPSPPVSSEPLVPQPKEDRPAKKVQFSKDVNNSRPRTPSSAPSSTPARSSTQRSRPVPVPGTIRNRVPSGVTIAGLRGLFSNCAELVFLFAGLAVMSWFALSAIQRVSYDSDGSVQPTFNIPTVESATSWLESLSRYLTEIPKLDEYKNHQDHKNYKDHKDHKDHKGHKGHKDYNDHQGHTGTQKLSDIDYEKLLDRLKSKMPESIWVPTDKHGKFKISEDFWHALKELIHRDESILSLDKSGISESHWAAIKSRLQAAGFGGGKDTKGTSGKHDVSAKELENLVDNRVSRSWESWLKQNENALKKSFAGVALTKDDFMKLFEQEASSYQREIKRELKDLQERVQSASQHISNLQHEISSTGGMAKSEIKSLVESLVSKTLSNAQLDAIARGAIKGHANDVLANQVNFFWVGAGAVVDSTYSSNLWNPPKHHFMSKDWIEKDGYKVQPRMAALTPWSQEGECFCAGPDLKGYGVGTNNVSVLMSRNIIPQHLVVEHILPGATLDPGAMPKDIEVWAYYEEINLRREVQAFSETYFPDTPKEVVLSDGWAKIGEFTYEKRNTGDGVQVFKLSDELARMDAHTDSIVVRALNNYGADHTCFYRLKMYGQIVEQDGAYNETQRGPGEEKKSWFGW